MKYLRESISYLGIMRKRRQDFNERRTYILFCNLYNILIRKFVGTTIFILVAEHQNIENNKIIHIPIKVSGM